MNKISIFEAVDLFEYEDIYVVFEHNIFDDEDDYIIEGKPYLVTGIDFSEEILECETETIYTLRVALDSPDFEVYIDENEDIEYSFSFEEDDDYEEDCEYFNNGQMENVDVSLYYMEDDGSIFEFSYVLHGFGKSSHSDEVFWIVNENEKDGEILEVPDDISAFAFVNNFVEDFNNTVGSNFELVDITTRIVLF